MQLEKLKKLVKDKRFQALACAFGGLLIVVAAFLFFHFVPRTGKDKTPISRSRKNQPGEHVNKNVANQVPAGNRILSTTKETFAEENEGNSTTTTTTTDALINQKILKEVQRKNESSHLPPPPIPEVVKKPPVSCDEWKVEVETLLFNLGRNADASDLNKVNTTLNKMFEVCNLPKEPLKDYLRKYYESKRETCLEAKVAGENDLKELKRLLEGLQVVDSTYKDDSLELRFVEKFVPPFVTPFKELEMSTFGVGDDANFTALVREANKAFPLARIFAPFVPLNAPQELKNMCKHASFKHLSLIAYLEHIIPKLKENTKDANSEANAQKHIRMLRLLKPKSPLAQEGHTLGALVVDMAGVVNLKNHLDLDVQPWMMNMMVCIGSNLLAIANGYDVLVVQVPGKAKMHNEEDAQRRFRIVHKFQFGAKITNLQKKVINGQENLLVCCWDAWVYLLVNVDTDKPVRVSKDCQLKESVWGADLHKGKLCVSSNTHWGYIFESMQSPKYSAALSGHQNNIPCVAFSPQGRYVATASIDQCLRLYDVTGEYPKGRKIELKGDWGWGVGFIPQEHIEWEDNENMSTHSEHSLGNEETVSRDANKESDGSFPDSADGSQSDLHKYSENLSLNEKLELKEPDHYVFYLSSRNLHIYKLSQLCSVDTPQAELSLNGILLASVSPDQRALFHNGSLHWKHERYVFAKYVPDLSCLFLANHLGFVTVLLLRKRVGDVGVYLTTMSLTLPIGDDVSPLVGMDVCRIDPDSPTFHKLYMLHLDGTLRTYLIRR